jgi:flagellar basal body P-ring formation protein FlgA
MTGHFCFLVAAILWALPASADILLAGRTLPARTVLTAADVVVGPGDLSGAITRIEDAVGFETRTPIYAGRPVLRAVLGPPAMVDRNEPVTLRFIKGALIIETEGRVLDRGGEGAMVQVMNLTSRMIVVGRVRAPGVVEVTR